MGKRHLRSKPLNSQPNLRVTSQSVHKKRDRAKSLREQDEKSPNDILDKEKDRLKLYRENVMKRRGEEPLTSQGYPLVKKPKLSKKKKKKGESEKKKEPIKRKEPKKKEPLSKKFNQIKFISKPIYKMGAVCLGCITSVESNQLILELPGTDTPGIINIMEISEYFLEKINKSFKTEKENGNENQNNKEEIEDEEEEDNKIDDDVTQKGKRKLGKKNREEDQELDLRLYQDQQDLKQKEEEEDEEEKEYRKISKRKNRQLIDYSSILKLNELFKIGDELVCAVISDKTNNHIALSLNSKFINSTLTYETIPVNYLISGEIQSEEDKGYIVSIGVNNCKAFLLKSQTNDRSGDLSSTSTEVGYLTSPLRTGSPIEAIVLSKKDSTKTLSLSLSIPQPQEKENGKDEEDEDKDEDEDEDKDEDEDENMENFEVENINQLKPGMRVKAVVNRVFDFGVNESESGIHVTFLEYYDGVVLQKYLEDTIDNYKEGQQLELRITFIEYDSKSIGLTQTK